MCTYLFPRNQSCFSREVLATANGFGYLPRFHWIMFNPPAHGIQPRSSKKREKREESKRLFLLKQSTIFLIYYSFEFFTEKEKFPGKSTWPLTSSCTLQQIQVQQWQGLHHWFCLLNPGITCLVGKVSSKPFARIATNSVPNRALTQGFSSNSKQYLCMH